LQTLTGAPAKRSCILSTELQQQREFDLFLIYKAECLYVNLFVNSAPLWPTPHRIHILNRRDTDNTQVLMYFVRINCIFIRSCFWRQFRIDNR